MKTPAGPMVVRLLGCSLFAGLMHPAPAQSQDAAAAPRDFSKTNSVSIFLAQAERRTGWSVDGLKHAYWQADSQTSVLNVEGVACRSLNLTEAGHAKGYFYFTMDPTFKRQEVAKVRIDVDYFDGFDDQLGVFGLQYDAKGADDGPGAPYRPLYPNVALKGSGQWLQAVFHIRDGAFQNSQNGESDFRLWASPPELCVSRVAVTLEPVLPGPPARPLSFRAGEAKLRDWNLQWDSGEKPAFSRVTSPQDGKLWLEIRLPGIPSAGSWRTAPLLEAGEYQFVGRVRTEGMQDDEGMPNGAGLRASGHMPAKRVGTALEGATLTYDFAMPASGYVELVCEFVGSQGTARFDLDSLKLIRGSKAPN